MSSKPPMTLTGAILRRPAAERVDEPTQRFHDAMRLMEEGRWRESFTRLAALADAGHPQAARLALIFATRGTLLFGGAFHASTAQRRCWELASD